MVFIVQPVLAPPVGDVPDRSVLWRVRPPVHVRHLPEESHGHLAATLGHAVVEDSLGLFELVQLVGTGQETVVWGGCTEAVRQLCNVRM